MIRRAFVSTLCATTMLWTQALAQTPIGAARPGSVVSGGAAAQDDRGPSTAAGQTTLPSGYRPAADSDEAGLWMMGDKAEENLKTMPTVVRDAALNRYVGGLMCKLDKATCNDTRLYILDIPYTNAAMSPNGAMQVWTGLLLRTRNEAQLACVLGHEMSHYTLRHTLAVWRKAVQMRGATAVLTLVSGGLLGIIAALGSAGELMRFSRDEEREADAQGQDMVAAAGYDPAQCAALWEEQLAEQKAEPDQHDTFVFLRSHPDAAERLATLTARAAAMPQPAKPWTTGAESFHAATKPFRGTWLAEELNRTHYGQSLALMQSLLADDPKSGETQYWMAEVYRRRNDSGDASLALDAYKNAIATGAAPAGAYRGLGLIAMKTGDRSGAQDAFQHYLDAAPSADDRAMVQYYLAHLGDRS